MALHKNLFFVGFFSLVVVIVLADQVVNKWRPTNLVYPCHPDKYFNCQLGRIYLWNCRTSNAGNNCLKKSDFCIGFDFQWGVSVEEPMVQVMSTDLDFYVNTLYDGPFLRDRPSSCDINFAPQTLWNRYIQKIQVNPNARRKDRFIQVKLYDAHNSTVGCCFKTPLTI